MGNDWFHEYFINELKAIGNHSKCADGKSAYDYAVEGGYTGTETEFAEKMAEEQLTGTTNELTPTQVYDAVSSGIPVKVQYTDPTFGISSFTAFNVSESMNVVASNAIVNYNNMYLLAVLYGIKSDNRWFYEITGLAEKEDIPVALPNPNSLTFTGAVTGSYDGSAPLSVEIPIGADGKSAYDYAVEGGYTGTETEFAEKLASGLMIVTITDSNGTLSADKSYIDIRDAILAGISVLVDYNDARLPLTAVTLDGNMFFGTFQCFSGDDVNDATIATVIIEITENNEVNDFTSQINIPKKLPNPNSLTFTGAVTGSYDGSEPLSVEIPTGMMIVTITDNNGTLSADMTFSEILNAINAGTTVLVSYNGTDLPLIALSDNSLSFGVFQCANADDVDPAAVATSMIEITANGEVNDLSALIFIPTKLPNPRVLKFTGAVTGSYDGSAPLSVKIPSAVTDDHINSLIDTKLGVIENGAY